MLPATSFFFDRTPPDVANVIATLIAQNQDSSDWRLAGLDPAECNNETVAKEIEQFSLKIGKTDCRLIWLWFNFNNLKFCVKIESGLKQVYIKFA